MSVLDRASLEQSPLADLHALASELSLDGYRRLRKPELIDAILERQGEGGQGASRQDPEPGAPGDEAEEGAPPEDDDRIAPEAEGEQPTARRRRGRRGGRGRGASREQRVEEGDEEGAELEDEEARPEGPSEIESALSGGDEVVEGVVELLPGGSGFLRVQPPAPSDDDVYISAAQVKRCELVSGDQVAGPRRPPRRSERFASLLRIDTINGRPASEVADAARFEDLPAAFPTERLALGSDEPTVSAIEALAPLGRGSRVTIAGGAQSGKTFALRQLATVLSRDEGLQLWLALAGVRPEEISEWREGPLEPVAAVALGASADAQGQAVEAVIDQARRMAARGAHAVVLVDTLDGVPPHAASKALGAARNLRDGGSLTVIATASAPRGGETTVIALDSARARAGTFPAIDPAASWTMRVELLW
jgi:transcription termination factor Rho